MVALGCAARSARILGTTLERARALVDLLNASRWCTGVTAGALYRCDATAAAIIVSLPPLADVPVAFRATFRRKDAGANAVTRIGAHNLLTFREAFDDAAWVKAMLSVEANAGYAPDNILSANRLIEDLRSGNDEIRQDFTKTASVTKLVAAIAAPEPAATRESSMRAPRVARARQRATAPRFDDSLADLLGA